MRFIGASKAFAHMDRLAAWQRGGKPAPVTIEWDLSNRCVLACSYGDAICHFAHTHSRGPWVTADRRLPMAYDETGDYANPALVKRALREVAAAGVKGVVWTGGGEPTTHPEWLSIARVAHEAGLEQGMYTLGGLLTPETGKAFASMATWVVVSLDCPDGESYAAAKGVPPARFKAACDGVRYLAAAGKATVGVSFMIHAENWMLMPEMVAVSRSLGATYTTFRPAIAEGPTEAQPVGDRTWIDQAMPALQMMAAEPDVECDPARFAEYRDWQGRAYSVCHGIKLNTTITPEGRVWVCPQRRGIAGSELGDLRRESFADIWARHPGQWRNLSDCRTMCRLHLLNGVLANVFQPRAHEAFV